MPQTTPEISDRPTVVTASPAQSGAADDPLLRLHKMSTTAGVGSTDYVAINGTAIAAIVVGFASLLVFVNHTLLFIPLVGIICAILALRQIRDSNGTQAGGGLAIVGLLMSLGIGGWVGAAELTESSRTRADRNEIKSLIAQLGEDIKSGAFDAAYEKTGPGFKQKVSKTQFVERMTGARSNPVFGTLQRIESNDLVVFQKASDGTETGVAAALFRFDKTNEPFRQTMNYRKSDGQWQLDAMPDLFPPPTAPGAEPGGPG
jgi:hypothetical protein